jgi:hypothetical protein
MWHLPWASLTATLALQANVETVSHDAIAPADPA